MMTSKKLPPKAATTCSQIFSFTFFEMTGMLSSRRMRLFCILGNTFLRIIFSMTSGTAMTMAGLTSWKACAMMAGEGTRVR